MDVVIDSGCSYLQWTWFLKVDVVIDGGQLLIVDVVVDSGSSY